jgi:hypothetical protein
VTPFGEAGRKAPDWFSSAKLNSANELKSRHLQMESSVHLSQTCEAAKYEIVWKIDLRFLVDLIARWIVPGVRAGSEPTLSIALWRMAQV